MILDEVKKIVPNPDLIMIFGPSGTGKSTFATSILKQISKEKKIKALYIDSERNLIENPTYCDYLYTPSFDDMYKAILNLKPGYDVVVVDSLGLPILGEFATLRLDQRGDVLLKAQSISYKLKKYSKENNCYVFVLNQPESEFAKGPNHVLRPFGDKSIFFYKEVWKTRLSYSMPDKTGCIIEAFRSRRFGREKTLFTLAISDKGVEIKTEFLNGE